MFCSLARIRSFALPLLIISGSCLPATAAAPTQQLHDTFQGDLRLLLNQLRADKQVVVIAHRGGSGGSWPENGMATVEHTTASAAVIVELDVITSADGVDVLIHDDTLDRTTNGQGLVAANTWADIRALDLRDETGALTDMRPISLDEALAKWAGHIFWMLDLKSPSSVASVVQRVAAAGMLPATAFIAYTVEQAQEVVAAAPDALLAMGTENTRLWHSGGRGSAPDSPIIALVGDIADAHAPFAEYAGNGDFVVAGCYLGEDPPENRMLRGEATPEFDNIGGRSVQLLTSNHAIAVYNYLAAQNLTAGGGAAPDQ